MHIHIGLIQLVSTFACVIIVGFFWRVIAGWQHDTAIGQAMAFIY
jgi:hypothetical protein